MQQGKVIKKHILFDGKEQEGQKCHTIIWQTITNINSNWKDWSNDVPEAAAGVAL